MWLAQAVLVALMVACGSGEERLLVVDGWFGRSFNNVYMLQGALEMAWESQRTLLISTKTHTRIPLHTVFNYSASFGAAGYKFRVEQSLKGTRYDESTPRASTLAALKEMRGERVVVLGSATPFYSCAMSREREALFWKHMRLSDAYQEAARALASYFGLRKDRYVAVHLRKLERECQWKVDSKYRADYRENMRGACDLSSDKVRAMMEHFGLPPSSDVFVASDGQDPALENELRHELGARFLSDAMADPSPPLDFKRFSVPFLDFALLLDAGLFLGTPLSTFAAAAASWRVSQRGENREVLAYPLLFPEPTVEDFWKCRRFRNWCYDYESTGKKSKTMLC